MIVNATGFVYDNQTSEEFNLIICKFDTDTNGIDSSSGEVEITKANSPIQDVWHKSGNSQYTEAISFSFQLAKSSFEPFDAYEFSAINRWLCRKDGFKDFMITRSDYDNIHFYVQFNISPIEFGGNILGINVNGVADSPHGYSHLIKHFVQCENETAYTILDLSDEIGYIYPDIEIKVKNDTDISITNLSDNNRRFYINNCKENETIYIDGNLLQITTDAIGHKVYDNSNYQFPRIINKYNMRKNSFMIKGNCDVTIKYRQIRKVWI